MAKHSTSSNTSTCRRKSPDPSARTESKQESQTRPTTSTMHAERKLHSPSRQIWQKGIGTSPPKIQQSSHTKFLDFPNVFLMSKTMIRADYKGLTGKIV